jgi:hypothetical protein
VCFLLVVQAVMVFLVQSQALLPIMAVEVEVAMDQLLDKSLLAV